jgi:hypothetical protein
MDMHDRRLQLARAGGFEINRKGPCGTVAIMVDAKHARKLLSERQVVYRYTEDGQVQIDEV